MASDALGGCSLCKNLTVSSLCIPADEIPYSWNTISRELCRWPLSSLRKSSSSQFLTLDTERPAPSHPVMTLPDLNMVTSLKLSAYLMGSIITVFVICQARKDLKRDLAQLHEWAVREKSQLRDCTECLFWRGPFWTASKTRPVYRLTVVDEYGKSRKGYARLGSNWLGRRTDAVEVIWDRDSIHGDQKGHAP
jgi:hypothetical protein